MNCSWAARATSGPGKCMACASSAAVSPRAPMSAVRNAAAMEAGEITRFPSPASWV